MAPLRVLYFAWFRERTGCAEESVAFSPEVSTVSGLVASLSADEHRRAAFATGVVRAAVNGEVAAPEAALHPGDEVAFFPPVTGG